MKSGRFVAGGAVVVSGVTVVWMVLWGSVVALKEAAPIQFVQPNVNYGVFELESDGETFEVDFPFKVWAEQPVQIERVTTTCGCMTASKLKGLVYEPGQEGKITLRINAKSPVGNFSGMAKVDTVPPSDPPIVLSLSAFFVQPPIVSPANLLVKGEFDQDHPPKTQITVTYLRPAAFPKLALDTSASDFGVFELADAKRSPPLLRFCIRLDFLSILCILERFTLVSASRRP